MQRLAATRTLFALCIACSLSSPVALAQQDPADWGIDPAILGASGSELLRQAPDAAIDGLFQAVHAASRNDADAQALCGLFEPGADRSLPGLSALATRLGPDSRDRFANAIADVLVGAMQSPPQPYDPDAAKQSLKAAGATAAILHDGFVRGLNAPGSDVASRDARCKSLRWLLDAMQSRPPSERAAMTRWLLDQGLAQLSP